MNRIHSRFITNSGNQFITASLQHILSKDLIEEEPIKIDTYRRNLQNKTQCVLECSSVSEYMSVLENSGDTDTARKIRDLQLAMKKNHEIQKLCKQKKIDKIVEKLPSIPHITHNTIVSILKTPSFSLTLILDTLLVSTLNELCFSPKQMQSLFQKASSPEEKWLIIEKIPSMRREEIFIFYYNDVSTINDCLQLYKYFPNFINTPNRRKQILRKALEDNITLETDKRDGLITLVRYMKDAGDLNKAKAILHYKKEETPLTQEILAMFPREQPRRKKLSKQMQVIADHISSTSNIGNDPLINSEQAQAQLRKQITNKIEQVIDMQVYNHYLEQIGVKIEEQNNLSLVNINSLLDILISRQERLFEYSLMCACGNSPKERRKIQKKK